MKRSKIFLIGKMSQKELEIFKKDLLEHSVTEALKIKNLNFTKEKIEEVINNSISHVLLWYSATNGNSLGELVRNQVMADLRVEYAKTYPTKLNRVKWPDLTEKRPFKKLLEAIQKLKILQPEIVVKIFDELTKVLTGRQIELLSSIYLLNTSVNYAELSEKFGVSSGLITREIKVIYSYLKQTLKVLEIEV